jgi:hypothetical protein
MTRNTLSAFEDQLLETGYALAVTDYKPDQRFLAQGLLGWMVEDALQDIPALTIEAKSILILTRGSPKRTIL